LPGKIWDGIISVKDKIIEWVPQLINAAKTEIPKFITSVLNIVKELPAKFIQIGKDIIQGLIDGIGGVIGNAINTVTDFVGGIVGGVKGALGISSPSKVFKEIGGYMAEGIAVGFGDEADDVEDVLTEAMSDAGDATAKEAIKAINNGIRKNADKLSEGVKIIIDQVLNSLISENPKFEHQGGEFDEWIATGMVNSTIEITSRIPQIIKPVIETIRGFYHQFVIVGEYCVQGIWNGFQNMRSWLESNVRSMMQSIAAAARSEMQIFSPSKVFAGIGSNMAAGIAVGFMNEMQEVEDIIRKSMPNADNFDTQAEQEQSGRITREEDGGIIPGGLQVNQNFYVDPGDYIKQQTEAEKNIRLIARSFS